MRTKIIDAGANEDVVETLIEALGRRYGRDSGLLPYERIVLNGVFDLGLRTIQIERDVIIEAGPSGATILGGGGRIESDSLFGRMQCGPFLVRVTTPELPLPHVQHVAFRNLRFSGWHGPAIFADACHGLEVSGCRFISPVPGVTEGVKITNPDGTERPLRQIAAILAGGARCTGVLLVRGNSCSFSSVAPGSLPDDEEFVGCVQTAFAAIHVLDNRIATRDDGIEIMFNRPADVPPFPPGPPAPSPRIRIDGNYIEIHSILGEAWLVHAAIICCANAIGSSRTEITNNDLRVSGSNATLFLLTGDRFHVEHNRGYHGPQPIPPPTPAYSTSFCLGLGMAASPLPDTGASFNRSTITGNTITGEADHGIWFFDPHDLGLPGDTNRSHDNRVEDNDFSGFTGRTDVVHFGPLTHDNWLDGSLGTGTIVMAGTNNHVP